SDAYEALWSPACDSTWSLTSARAGCTSGAEKFSSPARKTFSTVSGPDRDADRAMQAGQATLGRAEETRAAGPALSGCPHPGDPMPAFLSGPGRRPTPTPAC